MDKLIIEDLQVTVPIIQGGMGVGVSLSGLASAVANEGGIGVISATGIGMYESDFFSSFLDANKRILCKEIKKARQKTSGVIGVNLMVALSDYDELLQAVYDEEIDLVLVGAGLPLKLPKTLTLDKLKKGHTKFVPIVSSARAAKIIFSYWEKNYNHVPDAVVVEGPLAGGHLGFKKEQINDPDYTLEKILCDVIPVLQHYRNRFEKSIPIIVAGGIYTGSDIYKFMQQGAQGVQMGTRFVATEECDASLKFKEAYIKCKEENIVIINSPVGLPGRAISNDFLEKVASGFKQKFTCPCRCLKTCNFAVAPYCIALALTNAQQGKLEDGFVFAGKNAFRVDKILSVKELIQTLIEEYTQVSKSNN
jgi:NAD(P)H-dependent flavin oxidoreductase YrpB (nitropropane dioxygenase family)